MPDTAVTPLASPQTVTWGELIQAVYAQFEAAPQELNPTTLPGMPEGFRIVRNVQMSDFLDETAPPDDRKFYGVLAEDAQGNLVVALRGTETFTEWWDDLHFALTSFDDTVAGGGNVVDGFYRIYKTLTSTDPNDPTAATSGLFGHIDDGAPLTVTGHSMGGALATLLAVDMFVNAHLRPEVWTFGSPKVGDATFAATYGYHATVSWRIYNVPDVVPLVPIDLFGHYQHVNTGYPINSGDSTRVSLGCFHHLTTYLSVLSGGATPVDPDCRPPT